MFDAEDVDVDVLAGVKGGWMGELVGEYIFVSGWRGDGPIVICICSVKKKLRMWRVWYNMNWYNILVAVARCEESKIDLVGCLVGYMQIRRERKDQCM